MTLADFFQAVAALSLLVFVVTSMLSMGMSLTIPMIMQPLKNARLVLMALIANFVFVPLLAYIINAVFPLDEALKIGLIVLATAAGAPFIPKLAQGAKGNIPFSVGLMVLLMVVTVFYVPIVLPLLLPGVEVDPWAIAQSLIVSMLVPLSIGLLVKSHSPDTAAEYVPVMTKASSLAIVLLLVVGVGLNIPKVLALIGTGGIGALVIFIVGSFLFGFVLGTRDPSIRSVMGLGAAQRNMAAAFMVAGQNFGGDTMSFVLVGAILCLLFVLPVAKRLGAMMPVAAEAPKG
jgi:predicted Na+-dependent transporter